jgi:hypothetical protein
MFLSAARLIALHCDGHWSGLRSRLTPTSSFAVFPGRRAPTRGAEGMAFHRQANADDRRPNASAGHRPNGERSPRSIRSGFAKRNRAAQRTARSRSVMLTVEVPAATKAAHVAATEAAHVAEVCAGEMTAAELATAEAAHVAEVSTAELAAALEMSPVAVKSEATVEAVVKAVVEAAASDEDRTTKPVAIVVIRIGVAVTIVVAGAIVRPVVGVVVAVRIAAADHSGRDGRAWIITIAVSIAMPVAVCIAMRVAVCIAVRVAVVVGVDAPVYMRDLPMEACSSMMNAMGGVMNDRRRAGGGEWR